MSRLHAITGLLAAVAMFGCGAAPSAEDDEVASTSARLTARTVVTIQFDDSTIDQRAALAILNAHGMHATFYVNSGVIGDGSHLTWDDLDALAEAHNEIAGHTANHINLKRLKYDAALKAVCDDRATLIAHGFAPTSFAYPFGSFSLVTKQAVADCGYDSARGVSGVDGRSVFAETIPPRDAFATRTPPNPKKGTTVATLQGYVTAAETHGGGWVQLVFHRLCDCGAYSISPGTLDAFLAWLEPRATNNVNNTVVQTTTEVMHPDVP